MNNINHSHTLMADEATLSVSELVGRPHAVPMTIHACLPILKSPDTERPLILVQQEGHLTDGEFNYPLKHGCPVLYPRKIISAWPDLQASYLKDRDSQLQYFYLSQLKQDGEINAPSNSLAYEKHLSRMHRFCSKLRGITVDVGCDAPGVSAAIFPDTCQYVGLDPFAADREFRIIGVGEALPFRTHSVDNVVFNTSLDHILDHHSAIDEAFRVLKPGGKIVIATFAWIDHATLLTDSVHFHHFREFEIVGGLNAFEALEVQRFESPKRDRHRYGLYVRATRPAAG
jgi:SAM-dependent methyltransferase